MQKLMQAGFIRGKRGRFSGLARRRQALRAKKQVDLVNLDREILCKYTGCNERDENDTPKPPNDFRKG